MPDAETKPPEGGIEVTPEMIEAGLSHLYRYHPETGISDEETVTRIFRSMSRVRLLG